MDKEKVIAWLDAKVEALKVMKKKLDGISAINVDDYIYGDNHDIFYENAIHVNDINKLVELTGIEPITHDWHYDNSDCVAERYIVYKGVAFFDILSEEEL